MTWPTFEMRGNKQQPRLSMRDRFAGCEEEARQVEQAENFAKSHAPFFLKFLELHLAKGLPLVVQSPIRYDTSEFAKSHTGGRFIDRVAALTPGTQLLLKSVDSPMREFIFENQKGEEIVLPFAIKEELASKTNVYDEALMALSQLQG